MTSRKFVRVQWPADATKPTAKRELEDKILALWGNVTYEDDGTRTLEIPEERYTLYEKGRIRFQGDNMAKSEEEWTVINNVLNEFAHNLWYYPPSDSQNSPFRIRSRQGKAGTIEAGNCTSCSIDNFIQRRKFAQKHVENATGKLFKDTLWERAMQLFPKDTLEDWDKRQEFYNKRIEIKEKDPDPGLSVYATDKLLQNGALGYLTDLRYVKEPTPERIRQSPGGILSWDFGSGGSGHNTSFKTAIEEKIYPFSGPVKPGTRLPGPLKTKTRVQWLLDSNEKEPLRFTGKETLQYPSKEGGVDDAWPSMLIESTQSRLQQKYSRAPTFLQRGRFKPY